MITVICANCGSCLDIKKSDAKRSEHHFCNRSCYGKWRSKQQTGEKNKMWEGGKTKITCEICKKEVTRFPEYIKKRKHLFCSQNCYQVWRKEQSEKHRIIIPCTICNIGIKIYKEDFPSNATICCSKTCEGILKSQLRNGKNNPMFGKRHSKSTCKKIGDANRGKRYTEDRCKKMSENAKKGEKHPNWKGGTSFLPYCFKFNRNRRKAVRVFFGYFCICCGKHVTENIVKKWGQVELSVHHIDHDKEQGCNGRPFNLVPLCAECHAKELHHEQEYKDYINKTLKSGFEWGIWSREQYEIDVMYIK